MILFHVTVAAIIAVLAGWDWWLAAALVAYGYAAALIEGRAERASLAPPDGV